MKKKTRDVFRAAPIAIALVFGASAYTNSNTVPTSQAGDGAAAVSGYTVSAVHYVLNATTPSNADSLTFTVDVVPVAGSTIKAQLAAAGTWYTCTNVTTSITCNLTSPQATVTGITNLRIVIAQ